MSVQGPPTVARAAATVPRVDGRARPAGGEVDLAPGRPARAWPTTARLGTALFLLVVAVAVLAPLLAPYPPLQQHLTARFQLPFSDYLLGSDMLGRDVLSRMIFGARTSLTIALSALAAALPLATALGMFSAIRGGWPDQLLLRLVDVQLALPGTVLVLVMITVLSAGTGSLIVALAISLLPLFIRIARAATLRELNKDYVSAAVALGAPAHRLASRHLLPNIAADLLTQVSLVLPGLIAAEAGLSFIGLGISPAWPSWGRMISESLAYVFTSPYLVVIPVLALSLTTFGAFVMADALRRRFDPRASR